MGQQTVATRLSAADVQALLAALPGRLAGGDSVGTPLLTDLGTRALQLVAERFDALSVPGAAYGPTGETWPDNARATIRKKLHKPPRTASGRKLVAGRGYAVGVDSGDLREGLEPGPDGGPSGHPQQVFRLEGGAVVVGIHVPPDYPERFAAGGGKQPPRPLLPAEFPDHWRAEMGRTAQEAVAAVIVGLLG